jgi:hypothetical protein
VGTARVDDLEDLDDLDGPRTAEPTARRPGPGPGRWPHWPAGTPAWARGPVGALAAAVVAAVVAGAVTGSHVRAADAERRDVQAALLSLQVGTVTASPGARPPSGGRVSVEVVVPLVNHGPRPVAASVVGLSTPGQRAAHASTAVRIGPGTAVGVPLALTADCARIADPAASPDADGLPGRPPPSVAVRLDLPGGARSLRVPMLPEVSRTLEAHLFAACRPVQAARTTTTWTYTSDGHARISVQDEDPAGAAPLLLDLQQTPGLATTSHPALPVSVAPGRSVQVDLSVDPDCALVRDGYTSEVHLVQVDEDGAVVTDLSGGTYDPTTGVVTGTTAWLARQVALRCG